MEDIAKFQDFEDSEDALSLCDLPIYDFQSQNHDPKPCPDDDFFEFIDDPIIIAGRTISSTNRTSTDMISWGSESLMVTAACPSCRLNPANSGLRTTSAARSKKHAFLFGLPKFPPEMELSDIRRRQNLRSPSLMFSVKDAGEMVGGSEHKGRVSHWRLLRPLRCGAHLRSALGRAAFGCISPLV